MREWGQTIVCLVRTTYLYVLVYLMSTMLSHTSLYPFTFLISTFTFYLTVKRARKSSQSYLRSFGQVMPIGQLVKQTASVMQEYTQRGGVRPFGVSLLVAGLDGDGVPGLYQVDPSGAYFGWKATAIGKNYVSAKNFLEKRWTADMELEDAIHTALLTLREGFEGEMTAHNIQVGVVKKDGTFHVLDSSQIQDYLDEAT
jgi:20S proteasome subunit alpha 2